MEEFGIIIIDNSDESQYNNMDGETTNTEDLVSCFDSANALKAALAVATIGIVSSMI